MKRLSYFSFIRSTSKALTAIIILSICFSLFQPAITAQAALPPAPRAGTGQHSVSLDHPLAGAFTLANSSKLAPAAPNAPDWPPVFTKKFSPNPIYVGEISTLTFTIVNEVWMNLTGAAFTDPLPAGVQVAANPAASTTCLDATFNPAPGDTVLSFFGTLPGRGTCTARVNVTSSVPGSHFNITSELTTETGLIGAPASDTLVVLPRKYAISGIVWEDPNADGIVAPGEARLANVNLSLYLDNGNGTFNTGEDTFLANQLTGADGSYTFSSLLPGNYFVLVTTGVEGYVLVSGGPNPRLVILTSCDNKDNNFGYWKFKADLAVTKTDGVEQVSAGAVTTYTIRVTNNGPSTVTGATLVDTPEAGLVPTAVACSQVADNQCLTAPNLADLLSPTGISLPTLTPGQFYELRLTANVTATSGTVTNTARVTPPSNIIDPDLENNVASDTDIVTHLPKADLAVTKTDGVEQVNAGAVTTYTIRVTNNGPDPVTAATLVDTPSEGLLLTGVACSTAAGNQCVINPSLADLTGTWVVLPPLLPAQFYEIRLTATVTANTGEVTNTARVNPPAGTIDPNLENNLASDTDLVISYLVADLEVTKTDGVEIINTGEITTYTVRVTNKGPATVTGANLYDATDSGLTLLDVFCSPVAGNTCVTKPDLQLMMTDGITLPTLAPGQFYEVKLIARAADFSCITTNSAIVTPPDDIPDPDRTNNTAEDTDEVIPPPQANLQVTKTDGRTLVDANSVTTYTVRVTNLGPDPVTGASLIDSAGAGLSLLGVSCSAVEANQCVTPPLLSDLTGAGAVLPQLAMGQFYEIKLSARVTATSGTVINTTTVSPPRGTNDPFTGNNFASDTDTVVGEGTLTSDPAVTKSDGVTSVTSNSTTAYTIRVTNNGANPVTGARLVDSLGAGLTPVGLVCSLASGNQCSGSPSLNDLLSSGISLPTLTSGQFYEIRLNVLVTALSGTVTNIATVTPPPSITDTNLENNVATDTDIVTTAPLADLAVTKTDGVESVSFGGQTTYTVRVTNNGPDPVTGAILVDVPGSGLNFTGVACSPAASNQCTSAPLLSALTGAGVILPSLAPGQFYELSLVASVTATSGSVTNNAIVIPPTETTDPNLENNQDQDIDTVATLYHYYLPLIQRPPEESTTVPWNTVIGYEDLSLVTGLNDFDYNDWGVAIEGELNYSLGSLDQLREFSLFFTPLTRGGTYDHTFQIRIPAQAFGSDGTVVIHLLDENHDLISQQILPFNHAVENTFVVFPKTSDVFPGTIANTVESKPVVIAQRYADFTLTFNVPVTFSFDPDDLSQPHGQGLFFDPTLLVINNGERIQRGDVRLLSTPIRNWLWPEEGIRIDRAYTLVTYIPGTPPDFSFPASWWTVYNHCVYDGVPCASP